MIRPVELLALGFRSQPEQNIWNLIEERTLDQSLDLVLLPELWLGDDFPMDQYPDVLGRSAQMARCLGSYLVCPLYSCDESKSRRFNTVFVLDRRGELVCEYKKVFPYWSERELSPPCSAGDRAVVFDADFGRCGIATCFDVNFPVLWQELERLGAELILWPSDYSAGRALQAHAMTHHYYIVSATREADSAVYDLTGDEILYQKEECVSILRAALDLDRCLFHENFNLAKSEELLRKYPEIRRRRYRREQWFLLENPRGGVAVSEAAKEFELESLRGYIRRSGREINPDYFNQEGLR